ILYNILSEDPSFKSKLFIFDLAKEIWEQYSTQFFGLGYGKSEESLGIFPHNFFLLYFLELGIIGFSLKIIFLLYILVKSKFQCYIILFPYLIAVMSATGYGTHYLYTVLSLITSLSKIKI
ncbi:MAG: hypothetical protein K2H44_01090, partial [Muribaculaceae bacterium]|nr:hypothetical protein [Muribaculaceae bacterium]